jgi:hypothetical protein
MDWPSRILGAAVRRMPPARAEWGSAMRAELADIQSPRERWHFALGCARVALFPPGNRGLLWAFAASAAFVLPPIATSAYLDTWEGHRVRPGGLLAAWLINTILFTALVFRRGAREQQHVMFWVITFGAAGLFGLLAAGPFAFMEVWNNPGIRSGEFAFPFKLFLGLWTLPVMLFLAAAPIVRGLRAGEGVLAHPVALVLRVAALSLVSGIWLFLLWDQMPCFLGGVPGCD